MPSSHRFDPKRFVVPPGKRVRLGKRTTGAGPEVAGKSAAAETLAADVSQLRAAQATLYASGARALLVILQGMDAAGKDGTIKHVMHGVNPQGCRVHSFKAPNPEEQKHHFLWRPVRYLPERGMIGIFNRSYYEETIVVRVHPEFLEPQGLPTQKLEKLWPQRFGEINTFEKTLVDSGTAILKLFLHISPETQKKRLLERLIDPEKSWKLDERDLKERKLWNAYESAYEDMLARTSTKAAPWYVIPADDKWYARAVVADLAANVLERMGLRLPQASPAERARTLTLAQELRASPDPRGRSVTKTTAKRPAKSTS